MVNIKTYYFRFSRKHMIKTLKERGYIVSTLQVLLKKLHTISLYIQEHPKKFYGGMYTVVFCYKTFQEEKFILQRITDILEDKIKSMEGEGRYRFIGLPLFNLTHDEFLFPYTIENVFEKIINNKLKDIIEK